MNSFLGCVKEKTLSQNRCVKAKTLPKNGWEKVKTFPPNLLHTNSWTVFSCCTSWFTDLSKILYSTPQISEGIPFLFPIGREARVSPKFVIPLITVPFARAEDSLWIQMKPSPTFPPHVPFRDTWAPNFWPSLSKVTFFHEMRFISRGRMAWRIPCCSVQCSYTKFGHGGNERWTFAHTCSLLSWMVSCVVDYERERHFRVMANKTRHCLFLCKSHIHIVHIRTNYTAKKILPRLKNYE